MAIRFVTRAKPRDNGLAIQSRPIKRRAILALAVIASASVVSACGSSKSSSGGGGGNTEHLSVQVFSGSILNLPLYVAEQQGYFKAQNLSVTFQPISNGPLSIQAVSSGHLDVGYGSFGTVMAANAKGFDIKAIVADTDHNYWTLVASKKLPLPHLNDGYPAVMKDLVGKKIGVTARGAQSEFDVRTMFQQAGLSPDSATYVAVGSSDSAFAALKAGEVDAVQAFDPTQTLAIASGVGVAVVDQRKGQGPAILQAENGAYQLFFATGKEIAAQPKAIRGFVIAQTKAIAWLKDPANRQAALTLALQKAALGGLPPATAKSALSGLLDVYRNIWGATIDPKAITAANKYLLQYKLITKAISPSDLIYQYAPRPNAQ